jgi:RNA polymerase sigma-70 factor (ECF subfamily)
MERKIIETASKGDIKSFKRIFDYYVPRMRPICLRYSHTMQEADDILQESFIKVFRKLKDFKFEGAFEGWVRKIVLNTAINHFKKNILYYETENLEKIDDQDVNVTDIELEIENSEPSELIKLINELPPGYKIVFNLYVFEDYSHKEIAEMLGISEGTSRSQYSKSKKMLRKLIIKQRIVGKTFSYN